MSFLFPPSRLLVSVFSQEWHFPIACRLRVDALILQVYVFLQVCVTVCGFNAAGAQAIYVLIHARAGAW